MPPYAEKLLEQRDRLEPAHAIPTKPARNGQIWDPAIGAYRAQRVPIALSKSSFSSTSSDGRPNTPLSQTSSFSSYKTVSSSLNSIPSTYSYSSPPSIASLPSKYSSQLKARQTNPPKPVFKTLPSEIYDYILRQLKIIHESAPLKSCHTCHIRDLCSLALTSRAWDKAVVKHLYDRICIISPDSKEQVKKFRIKIGTRLKLLRRTLRGRAFLAQHVRILKVPQLQPEGETILDTVINLVASVVMACPNLEKLEGCYSIYGHEFDRLTHALSTRRSLKEQVWLIGENAAITQRSRKQLAPGLMDPEQKSLFANYHNMWASLTTLFLHSPNQGILEKDVFVSLRNDVDPRKLRGPGILHRLPSLQNLCISNFDMDDFDDYTLQHLPPVQNLRLQDLEGVTFWGLSEFSRTRNAFAIRKLALVNMDVLYISAISNLLLRLKNLKKFTLVQDTSPEVPPEEIVIQPIIAAPQLEFLHWDIVVPGSANDNLVASVRAGGFPRLRKIRAPSDHYGTIQALCKPRAQVELPSDWSAKAIAEGIPSGGLRAARRAAQQRLEDAWTTVQYKLVVEEDGVVHEIFDFNGFMGTVGSKIDYTLEPDVEGSDCALIDFEDLVRSDEEGLGSAREICRGSWNAQHSAGVKWWRHQDRPRWRSIDLMKFF